MRELKNLRCKAVIGQTVLIQSYMQQLAMARVGIYYDGAGCMTEREVLDFGAGSMRFRSTKYDHTSRCSVIVTDYDLFDQ